MSVSLLPISTGSSSLDDHKHVTLAYIDKSQTVLNVPLPKPEFHSTEEINARSASSKEGASKTNAMNNQTNNVAGKSISMGCISQINYVYQIKAIKQKQLINGVLYSLQEIYGIEKKSSNHETEQNNSLANSNGGGLAGSTDSTETTNTTVQGNSVNSKEFKANYINNNLNVKDFVNIKQEQEREQLEREQEIKGIECVICTSEIRDVIIMPCRHLCLCKMCAANLRVQSNNCPICRIPCNLLFLKYSANNMDPFPPSKKIKY